VLAVCLALVFAQAYADQGFDDRRALEVSQAAVGNVLADYTFTDRRGRPVSLREFRGRPLLISLVYTSCAEVCSVSTRHLAKAVDAAREALGADSFSVITIGFDVDRDTPQAMADYARQQGVNLDGWKFLSADRATIDALTRQLGFIYRASPKGFDHLLQVTLVDGGGRVHRQLYGELFQAPLVVEPLKALVFGVAADDDLITAIGKRVRLFCTTYDAASGRYYFDYSLFIGMAVGGLIIGATGAYLIRELRRGRAGGT